MIFNIAVQPVPFAAEFCVATAYNLICLCSKLLDIREILTLVHLGDHLSDLAGVRRKSSR